MLQAQTKTYSANDPIETLPSGFSIKVGQLEFICGLLYINQGQITVTYPGNGESAAVPVPEGITPSLEVTGIVTNSAITGFTVTSFDFGLSWGSGTNQVGLTGAAVVGSTIDDLLLLIPHGQVVAAYKAFNSLDIKELEQLAGATSLPPIDKWPGMENNEPPTRSTFPNSLNAKQAKQNASVPTTFTVATHYTPAKKQCICYRLTCHNGQMLKAEVSFYDISNMKQSGKAKLLKSWDVTSQLGDSMAFNYVSYWTSVMSVPAGAPLDVIQASTITSGNSQVIFQSGTNTSTVVFNFGAPQVYDGGVLIPMTLKMGIFPVVKS